MQPALAAEQAVGEVADGPTDDQPGGDGGERAVAGRGATDEGQADDHDDGDGADDRAEAAARGERHAAVERQVELQRPDDVAWCPSASALHRPVLGQLVEQHDDGGDDQRQGEPDRRGDA